MRRRRHDDKQPGSPLPPILRNPPVVEDWVSEAEIGRHRFDETCPCGEDCETALMILARRRHGDQVDEHLSALGLSRRNAGALWGRARWSEVHRAAS